MAGLIFDIETNGLLPTVTKVHCLVVKELGPDGRKWSVGGHTDEGIRNLLPHLEEAPLLIGHNIIEYDIPVLKKVYPGFNPKGNSFDTLLDSQWMYTDLRDLDFNLRRKNPDFPTKLIGRHSLEAWGVRLGHLKGDFGKTADWEQWSQAMQDYCERDVTVTEHVYNMIVQSVRFNQRAHNTEMEFKPYILDQEKEGFPLDQERAKLLYAELAAERADLEKTLAGSFEPWEVSKAFVPKRDNKTRGYKAGVPFNKTKLVHFNPRSHSHIADRLIKVYGWQPEEFTEGGSPSTDVEVLTSLAKSIPVCVPLSRHAELQKIIGMVSEGKSAYLKLVTKEGRLHGRVGTCSTVTARCNHYEPNLGNVPRRSDLGVRVRGLFTAIPGYSLVGSDAKGLELRCLAHYLAKFDGGEYAKLVVEGDPHKFHQELTGLPTKDVTKTFFYGWLYGAGDTKIGSIISKGAVAGKRLRLQFLNRFPALSALKSAVGKKAKGGFINGIDGRRLVVRSEHAALNTLLQSCGAILMKEWLLLINREIRQRGLYQAADVRQVAFVHDEIVALVRNGKEEEFENICTASIEQAGEHFGLRVKLACDTKRGHSWQETH